MKATPIFKRKFMYGLAIGLCCSSTSFAAVKPGLWEATTTMNMGGGMPQIPPAQLEQMKNMGIKIPGATPTTTQYCLTPEMAAKDTPPTGVERQGCTITNLQKGTGKFSADLMCDGQFKGTGHIDATITNETSYATKVKVKGTSPHSPVPIDMTAESSGHWLSADCGAIKPLGQK